MKPSPILDCFILTFQDNTEPIITTQQGSDDKYSIVPSQWLHDMTRGQAKFVEKNDEGIEIAIPIGTFLDLKENRLFQSRCTNLIRLRTSPRSILNVLCHPIRHIDNRILSKV